MKTITLPEKEFNVLERNIIRAFKSLRKQAKKIEKSEERFLYVPLNENHAKFLSGGKKCRKKRKK